MPHDGRIIWLDGKPVVAPKFDFRENAFYPQIIRTAEERIWATEHAFRIIPLAKFNTRFLASVIDRLDLNRLSARTAQHDLISEMVHNHVVGIPPISEQKAIAAFLDQETARIDALLEKNTLFYRYTM